MFNISKSKAGYNVIVSDSIWMSDNDFGMFAKNTEGMQKYYLGLFEAESRKQNLTLRVYRTANGMRAFIVNAINVDAPLDILRSTSSDPMYIMARCRDMRFRCRISPKKKPKTEYFAVTKYITTIGEDSINDHVAEFVDFHDQETQAFSGYPLV